MIKFDNVYIKYISNFYSLFKFNHNFEKNTFIIDNSVNGGSSIFRILSKIDKHFTGDVFINNTNIKEVKDRNLNVAYVPEKVTLFKSKTVEQNLIYPLIIRKINKKLAKTKALNLLETFNLTYILQKHVKDLNNDEQKILCLLRAIIREPQILLLEHFFKDLDRSYISLANNILKHISTKTLFIACEESNLNIDCFETLEKLELK